MAVAAISRLCRVPIRRLSSASITIATTRTHHPSSFASTLSLLKISKDPNHILQTFFSANLTPNTHHHRLALSAAISNLAASNSFLQIRLLLVGLPPEDAIVFFGRAGMLEDASQLFDRSTPTTKTLNALLFACVLTGKHEEVEPLFRENLRRHRICPDLTSYNTVIKALCQSGSSRSVFAILDEMWRKGVKPNSTSYNTLIAGLHKEEKFEDVDRALDLMKSNKCHAGISTQNTRIQSLCKLGKSTEALELLKKIKLRGMKLNSVTYHHLIHGFCREGDMEEAKRLFGEMGEKGHVADSGCYFTMIYYLCQGGELEEGLRICRESMERNWFPRFSTLKILVEGLVSDSKIEEAREIVEAVKGKFPGNAEMWKLVEDKLIGGCI